LNYVLAPDARDPGRRFTAADAATLRGLGFSVVRLGIIWAALEPGPADAHADDPTYCSEHLPGTPFPNLGAADPYNQATVDAYLTKVDTIVRLLAHEHIRVLLDMHQDAWGLPFANPSSQTPWMAEGAPAWATCTSGTPFERPAAWQSAYTDPAVNAAFQHFWANDVSGNLQGQYIRALAAVARHFAGNADVLGYELFNEPAGPLLATPPEFDRQLQCFYAGTAYAPVSCAAAVGPSQAPADGAIPSVLAADPHHLAFYEAPVLTDYGAPETVGIAEPLPFGRLVLSFHDYGGMPGGSSFACTQPTCPGQEQNTMSLFSSERAATRTDQPGGPAWLLSEFGAEPYTPDIANMARLADRNLLSWTYWSGFQLHDPTGGPDEGLVNELTRQPDRARAAVLARTYPLATAGTPLTQSFDTATGAFAFTYRADPRVHAATEITVPIAYHYPHGYDVTVHGARVTSRPDAQLLTVVNYPGASTVTITLRARSRSRSRTRSPRVPDRRPARRPGRRPSAPAFTG
jgi:endoglycosylceramidase